MARATRLPALHKMRAVMFVEQAGAQMPNIGIQMQMARRNTIATFGKSP
jgi:hypothetical protein